MSTNTLPPRTLHWFFSLGTGTSSPTYVLAGNLAERLRPFFPSVRPAVLAPGGPYPEGSSRVARSVTGAMLHLLGEPAPGVNVRFHLHATREIVTSDSGTSPFHVLTAEAPAWAKTGLAEATGRREEDWLASRDLDKVGRVVDTIVGGTVKDGDYVLLETTNGLRPFTLGVMLAHSVLRATRPEAEVLAAVYGEHHGWGDYSPIHDHSDFLDLPLWASAAESLRRRFDVGPLSDLVRDADPALAKSLTLFARCLDLGWPSDLVAPLVEARGRLDALASKGRGRGPVLELVRQQFEDLTVDVHEQDAPLEVAGLRFRLGVVELLTKSSRFGDAVRVLREAMVDAALLAASRGAPVPGWRDPKRRASAEGRLFRANHALWKRIGDLRNAVSHARSSVKHDGVDAGKLVAAFEGSDGDPGILEQVRRELFDGDRFRHEFLAEQPAQPLLWFRSVDEAHPYAAAYDRLVETYQFDQPLPLRLPAGVSTGPAASTWRLIPKRKEPCTSNWLEDRRSRASGSRDVILDLAERPMEQSLLAAALRDEGIRPWALVGDALWPLFLHRP